MMANLNASDRPVITINLNDTELDALIDSGADINVVDAKWVRNCPLTGSNSRVNAAVKGQQIQLLGYVRLNFCIHKQKFESRFAVVENLEHPMLLGREFLIQEEVTLDFKRRCMYVGRRERLTAYWGSTAMQSVEEAVLPDFAGVPDPAVSLVKEFSDLFEIGLKQPTTRTTKHVIRLTSDKIVHRACYPMNPTKKAILAEQVQEMLRAGVIERSTSAYASSPVLVMREGKKPRFCIDFRELNQITATEMSCLPRIPDALRGMDGAKIFSVLDLKSGYWQIPLDEKSKPYTAFTTPDGGAYQFSVMPFGLKNAPSTFQKLMAGEVLTGYLNKISLVYLDDIVIFSRNEHEHLQHLRLIFERLREHGLRVSAEKCQLFRTDFDYLGFRIQGDNILPKQEHLKQVAECPTPKSKKQLQSFLGICGWVREHIDRYSEITTGLTDALVGTRKAFKWTPTMQESFEETKKAVATAAKLTRPDFSKPFVLQTDASQVGMAAVLFQEVDGQKRIISFASAKFKPAERRYHINEQECLALVWAINKYRGYLEDSHFTVRTDSRSLTWLHRFKDGRSKLTRWALLLQEFAFKIEHIPGTRNQLPDFLSRNPDDATYSGTPDDSRLLPDESPGSISPVDAIALLSVDEMFDKVARNQARVAHIQQTKKVLIALEHVHTLTASQQKLIDRFVVANDLLWRRHPNGDRIVVPAKLRDQLIHTYHDTEEMCHPGAAETLRKIHRVYFWGYMHRDVYRYVANCVLCSITKSTPPQKDAPERPRVPKYPFEMISLDVIGPYAPALRTGFEYAFIAEDVFSKWIEAKAVQVADADALIRFLEEEIIARYGPPRTIVTDNGTVFKSNKMEKLCQKYKINQAFSSVAHQRANPVERRMQEVKKVMRVLLREKAECHWAEQLPKALKVLRARKNRATGETPSSIVLGYELPEPGEWRTAYAAHRRTQNPNQRKRKNRMVFERQLQFQNQAFPDQQAAPPITFEPGQRVNVKVVNPGSFAPKWEGPYEVVVRTSPTTYDILIKGKQSSHHVDNMRPAPEGNEVNFAESEDSSDEEESEDDEYEFPEDLRRTLSEEEESEDEESEDSESVIDELPVEAVIEDEAAIAVISIGSKVPGLLIKANQAISTSEPKLFHELNEEITQLLLRLDETVGQENVKLQRRQYIKQLLSLIELTEAVRQERALVI